ncbi:2-hydroxyacid dehydrogenase [Pseudonocardia cypriaca]|uniref:Lactate dehydrogenase-like 2-hydroxyacid dehydrogenase n=1 Tax=Pseudonocardia cypriaca TaxID=882449 RepID=A0A543FT10_9PSEU|nr:2-hydroxyacid dehydrogenase [Pseudonocardia cypriaca]TQM36951.1 lactate dehydrogenase-like 2-hydroxyacid dehydrogenase [Pseudonocardia cypriaca]
MTTTERVELAVIGRQRPAVIEALGAEFTLHEVAPGDDVAAALGPAAERVRGALSNPMVGLSAEVMEALPKLEIVALFGVGLERTDLSTARERGIVVTTTPVLYEDVADTAVALAMDVSRRITSGDRWVRAGGWAAGGHAGAGRRFSGKRAGILGLGRIGRMLAKRLEAFDMRIAYYDPRPAPDVDYPLHRTGLELARESDFLFLCAAGGPGQRHLVDADVLAALGPEGVFVNIARGWLVDEAALVDAVVSGAIGGAGLDVFDDEPNVPQALVEAENVVLTPHIASNTVETRADMDQCMIDNIRSWFSTGQATTPVP